MGLLLKAIKDFSHQIMHPSLSMTSAGAAPHSTQGKSLSLGSCRGGPSPLAGKGHLYQAVLGSKAALAHPDCIKLPLVGRMLHETFIFRKVFSPTKFRPIFLRQ